MINLAEFFPAATRLASNRSDILHAQLNAAVVSLDARCVDERAARLELLRHLNVVGDEADADGAQGVEVFSKMVESLGTVLEKDDPILQWASLHRAVPLRDDASVNSAI